MWPCSVRVWLIVRSVMSQITTMLSLEAEASNLPLWENCTNHTCSPNHYIKLLEKKE